MRFRQFLHDPAEGQFTVCAANWAEMPVQPGREILQITVVGEDPIPTPQLAHEGMAVLQIHGTLRGFADVRNDIAAFDRVASDQLCDS